MIKRNIENGPSHILLMFGFFVKIDGKRRPVEFRVQAVSKTCPETVGYHRISVVINQLQWKDLSGERWNFDGYIAELDKNSFDEEFTVSDGDKVNGYYDISSGKGYIEVNPA